MSSTTALRGRLPSTSRTSQFTFDLIDGYANPADVDTPPVGNSAAQIRKVNLLLATRSRTPSKATGHYQYQTLTTQVALRSLSFRDRYP